MNVIVTRQFEKDADKELNKNQSKQLSLIIENIILASSIREIKGLKKLKGYKNAYRIKLGDFRIGFLFEDETIKLSRVLNRNEIYRYFP